MKIEQLKQIYHFGLPYPIMFTQETYHESGKISFYPYDIEWSLPFSDTHTTAIWRTKKIKRFYFLKYIAHKVYKALQVICNYDPYFGYHKLI
jgi:hypothetical protein